MSSALWPKLTLNSVTAEHLKFSFIESELIIIQCKSSSRVMLLSVKSDHIETFFIFTFRTTGRWVTALISIVWLVYIIH